MTSTAARIRRCLPNVGGLRPDQPPGPLVWPIVGPLVEYRRNPFGFMERMARDFGDVVYTPFAGQETYLVSHPDAIEHVLVKNRKNYVKGALSRRLHPLLGEGLLISSGARWTQQRKLMAPAFHHRRIATYAQAMSRISTQHAHKMQAGTRSVDQDMMALTLDIAVETLFGTTGEDTARSVSGALAALGDYFAEVFSEPFPTPLWVPTQKNRRFNQARAMLNKKIEEIIDERQREPGGDDLLSMLLEATDEQGRGMSKSQLFDEVITLFLAGHETTALTLTYALHLLGQHPQVRTKLETEAREVLGDRQAQLEDLAALPYTLQVVKEAMRLYPPAPVMGRSALEEDKISGYSIPKGGLVAMSQWVVHRDPRWYDAPQQFLPERWTPEFEASLPRFAYFPFGGGPRICIGQAFAMMEAQIALATLAQHFRFEATGHQPLELQLAVTARPKNPVLMEVVPRR